MNGQVAVDMFKEGFSKACKCENRAYSLIFMDLQMPVMGGIEASKIINDIQLDSPGQELITHIVALTAYTNANSIKECLDVGIKKVLNKPLNFDHLHEVMWINFFRVTKEDYLTIY